MTVLTPASVDSITYKPNCANQGFITQCGLLSKETVSDIDSETVSDITCIHVVGCCNAAHILAISLHDISDCTNDCTQPLQLCNVTLQMEMHSCPSAPWAPATNGSLVWAQRFRDASSKLFNMVLRSQHGWQLDGHVKPSLTYSQTVMSVIMTWL